MKRLVFLGSVLFMVACGSEEAKHAGEHVKDAAHDAAHKTEEHVKDAAHKVEEHVEKVAEEVKEEVAEAISGDVEKGEALFTEKGCVACHAPDSKVVGPSLVDISAGYNKDAAKMASFLKEESEAIIDPEQFAVMQGNLAITKEMSEEDLNALVAFIVKH